MFKKLLYKRHDLKLKKALLAGDKGALAKALRGGADPNLAFSHDLAPPRSALCHALEAGQPECLRLLLEAGAALPATTAGGEALGVAAVRAPAQPLALLSVLLGAGVDPDADAGAAFFACLALADDNLTLLLTNRLMQYGGDINCRDGAGHTPLELALRRESPLLVGALIASGAHLPGDLDQLPVSPELKELARRKWQDLQIQRQLQQG